MADEPILSKAELISKMQGGWDDCQSYLKTLTEPQLTIPSDAAGWTVKDHVSHMAAWEDSVYALLTRQARREYMGVDLESWQSGNYDRINEVLRQRDAHLSLPEALKQFETIHHRLMAEIQSLSDDDLHKPYSYFQPETSVERPAIGWIVGNTYEHYAEHKPWIAAIVAKSP